MGQAHAPRFCPQKQDTTIPMADAAAFWRRRKRTGGDEDVSGGYAHPHPNFPGQRRTPGGHGPAAAAAGLDELYVTDHCDLLDGEGRFAPDFDWPAALAQMAQAREGLTDRLQLRLGLELGSAPFDPAAAGRS